MAVKEYKNPPEYTDIVSEPEMFYSSLFPPETEDVADGKLNVVSLFSGCGGMDVGIEGGFICHKNSITNPDLVEDSINNDWVRLKPNGMKTVFACDILPEARTAWLNYMVKRRLDPSVYHLESVVELVRRHKKGERVFPEKVDIVTGGFPCQDFSVAGKRRGFESKVSHDGRKEGVTDDKNLSRGKLYLWMKEVIEITQPNIFIAENVKGLVSLGDVKRIIQEDFSKAGGDGYYVFDPQVLHAANYGVPESRERVIFIGIKKNALRPDVLKALEESDNVPAYLNPYPKPTHSNDPESGLSRFVSCEDVLGGLKEPEESIDPSHHFYSKAKYLTNGTQGQTEINFKGIGPTIRAEHHGNIEFRRLSFENGGKNEKELELGMKQRRLSPRECALIQTFPPDYNFVLYHPSRRGFAVSPSMAYKIIGNAVPPLLAYNIASRIEQLWPVYFQN